MESGGGQLMSLFADSGEKEKAAVRDKKVNRQRLSVIYTNLNLDIQLHVNRKTTAQTNEEMLHQYLIACKW